MPVPDALPQPGPGAIKNMASTLTHMDVSGRGLPAC